MCLEPQEAAVNLEHHKDDDCLMLESPVSDCVLGGAVTKIGSALDGIHPQE